MSIQEILHRRSIRKFTGEIIPQKTVQELLQIAMSAPSARCCDPWHFTVFNGEFCREVVPALSNGQVLVNANNGILVCADVKSACAGELSYAIQDCSASIQNFILGVSMKGLGSCWMGVHPIPERVECCKKIFDLPEHLTPIAIISFGVPLEKLEARTRYCENKVNWKI